MATANPIPWPTYRSSSPCRFRSCHMSSTSPWKNSSTRWLRPSRSSSPGIASSRSRVRSPCSCQWSSINWNAARSYCETAGMRLPTEAEGNMRLGRGPAQAVTAISERSLGTSVTSGDNVNEVGRQKPSPGTLTASKRSSPIKETPSPPPPRIMKPGKLCPSCLQIYIELSLTRGI